jgi:hypothetical protein
VTAASAQLEYAPGAPLRRQKRVRRIATAVLLLALMLPAYRYARPAYRRMVLLYAQHRCLAYSPAADLVAYENATPQASALLARPGYVLLPTFGAAGPGTVAGYRPPPLTDLEARIGGTLSGGACAVLFLHELRDSSGNRRLVIVFRDARSVGPLFEVFGISGLVMNPATFRTELRPTPKAIVKGWVYNGPGWNLPAGDLRFYAGQIDSNDPGHFTIRYEMESKEGIVDGRLNATGDDVDIKVISGPAVPPSAWSSPLPPSFSSPAAVAPSR